MTNLGQYSEITKNMPAKKGARIGLTGAESRALLEYLKTELDGSGLVDGISIQHLGSTVQDMEIYQAGHYVWTNGVEEHGGLLLTEIPMKDQIK